MDAPPRVPLSSLQQTFLEEPDSFRIPTKAKLSVYTLR